MDWFKSEVGKFVLKAAGIYIGWYLFYELWLLPEGSVDQWITTNIVAVSAGVLEYSGYHYFAWHRLIGLDETAGIYLVDGCSGIAAIGLFIGFIIAYPGEWGPKVAFIFFGIGIIYLVNILRIITLVIVQGKYPRIFSFTHDYSTTAIFYLVIFGLWIIWANRGTAKSPSVDFSN